MKTTTLLGLIVLPALLPTLIPQLSASPLDTAFTYQGRLSSGPNAANGSYDFTFGLYDAPSGGNPVSSVVTNTATVVTNGCFTAVLDFGGAFDGNARWLEIGVRTNGDDAFTLLSPRQALTPGPYAITAANLSGALPAAQLSGTIPSTNLAGVYANAVTFSNAANRFAGDGRGLTNLDGTAIQPGTVNSNAFDAPTKAQLALARGGTNSTSRNLLMTADGTTGYALFTNGAVVGDPGSRPYFYVNPDTNVYYSTVRDARGGWLNQVWEPDHGSGKPEFHIDTSGSMAVGVGFSGNPTTSGHWLQMGIGGLGQEYMYFQYNLIPITENTNLFPSSYPMFWKAKLYTNSNPNSLIWVGSGTPEVDPLPAMLFRATSTNGSGAWIFYDKLSPTVRANKDWDWPHAVERLRITVGPDGGLAFNGKLTVNGAVGLTTNYALADGNTLCVSNGIIVGILPPLPPDTSVAKFCVRVGGLSPTYSNALQNFVSALKVDGTWTNLDAIYPFVGANASTNGQNLISTNYTLQWSGAFGTNDATGVHNNGSPLQYADTQWKPLAQNSGTIFAFVKLAGTTDNYRILAGVSGGNVYTRLYYNSGASTSFGYNCAAGDLTTALISGTPNSIALVRPSSTHMVLYGSGSSTPASDKTSNSTTPPTYNLFIFDGNDSGTASGYPWNGKLQGFAMGTNAIPGSQYATLHNAFVALNTALAR